MAPIILQNTLILNPTGGPDILTSVIPNGTQGTFYTFTMTAGGGTLPYVWSLASGTLDSGVTLSAGGIISGTPANAETDNITIRVTDAIGRFITKSFIIVFNPTVNPLTITTTSPLPGGNEFNPYSTTINASGGTPPYTWSVIAGAFQTGITITPSTGIVSGTPTTSGTATPTVQVQDSLSNTNSKVFSLTISAPAPLIITTGSTLPIGATGTFYSVTLAATGGIVPYTWTILSGTLQTGLTLSSTGTISGTPTQVSTNSVTIQVQDNVGTTTSKTFSLAVFAPLVLTGATLPIATTGVAYSQNISGNASGGKTPYTFSEVSTTGSDSWAVSAAGVISGTPTGTTSTDTVTVQVTDANTNTAQATYTIPVNVVVAPLYKFNPGDYAMTVQYQHNVTLAFAQTDINTLAANPVIGGNSAQGYVMGANWAAVETGAQVDNPTFDQTILNTQYPGFAVWEQIFDYLQQTIHGAHMGISIMGNQYGKHFPSSTYTTFNWGNGQFIPAYIATCGGSLTVPNGYGATTHITYPVAPLYSGSSYYGFALDALNTSANPQEFTAFVPAFWNPGVNQAFINFLQAASHYIIQGLGSGSAPYAGMTFDQCPLIEFLLMNDEWSYGLNQNPSGGQAINPPNFTNSANQPTRANAEAAYELMFRSVTDAFPRTFVATDTSFTFGTVQTPAQTAAMVNNNISGTGLSLSTIQGLALCAADTFGTDWTSAGGANYAKQGYVGVTSPAFGSTIVATSKTLKGAMPIFAQIQPSDYNIHLPPGVTSYTAGAVKALSQSADNSYIQATHRIWCMADDRFLSNQGAWTGYVQPALVAGTGITPFSTVVPTTISTKAIPSIYTNHSGPSVNGQGVGWANDFSFGGGNINGSNTTNLEPGHSFNLKATATAAYQPAASWIAGFPVNSQSNVGPCGYNLGYFAAGNPNIQDGPFTDMTLDLWTANPTHPFLNSWNSMGFFSAGFADTANALGLGVTDFTLIPGQGPLVGSTWQTIKIPLPYGGQLGLLSAYKTAIKDNQGGGAGAGDFYIDNFGFIRGNYSWIFNGGLPNGYSNTQIFNAGSFVVGQNYVINTVGTTNFTAIGAPNNNVGQQFFATGAGSGSGSTTGNYWIYDAATPINNWADASVNATVNYAYQPCQIAALGTGGRNFSCNGMKTPGYGVQLTTAYSGTTLTATNVSGSLLPNMVILQNGSSTFPYIVSQLTGTTGGNGTYQVSVNMGSVGASSGAAFPGTTCAHVTNNSTNAAWKVTQTSFSLSGFNRFTFGVLPTNGTHSWQVQFYNTSGVATGSAINIVANSLTYTVGDNSTNGWTVYVIPLSAFGSLPTNIGGVSIQDTSSVGSNSWFLSAIAFMS